MQPKRTGSLDDRTVRTAVIHTIPTVVLSVCFSTFRMQQVIKTRMYCRMVGSLLHAYDYSDAACSGVHTGCNHGTALQEPKAVYDVTCVECAGDAMTFKVQVSYGMYQSSCTSSMHYAAHTMCQCVLAISVRRAIALHSSCISCFARIHYTNVKCFCCCAYTTVSLYCFHMLCNQVDGGKELVLAALTPEEAPAWLAALNRGASWDAQACLLRISQVQLLYLAF
jgi:hypothetical protein